MTDTSTPPPPPAAAPVAPAPKSRNCWVVGCLGCLGLLLISIVGLVGVVWFFGRGMVAEPFEPVELPAREQRQVESRLQSYNMMDERGRAREDFEFPSHPIELSDTDVNYWISRSDTDLADALRVRFDTDTLELELRGEYLFRRWPITTRFHFSYEDDQMDLRILDARVGRFSLPRAAREEFAATNLLKDWLDHPDFESDFTDKIERIQLRENQILVVPR